MNWKNVLKTICAIIVFVGALYGVDARISKMIEDKINDPEFIGRVAQEVRPAIVFDHNGSVLSDSGGMRYIKEINVVLNRETKEPQKIILSPNQFLSSAPIIECLNYNFNMKASRGKKYDWIYEITGLSYVVFERSAEVTEYIFRCEIVR